MRLWFHSSTANENCVKGGNGQLAFIRENGNGNTLTVKNAKASDQSMDFNIMCFSVKNNHSVHCIFFKNFS